MTEILKDLIALLNKREMVTEEWSKSVPRKPIAELYHAVSATNEFLRFQEKYGLTEDDVYQVIVNISVLRPVERALCKAVEIIDAHNSGAPLMPVPEKPANASSKWAHDKAAKYAELFAYEEGLCKKGRYKGLETAYRDAACMFDALTTPSKHLPPEIKPYLIKEETE